MYKSLTKNRSNEVPYDCSEYLVLLLGSRFDTHTHIRLFRYLGFFLDRWGFLLMT